MTDAPRPGDIAWTARLDSRTVEKVIVLAVEDRRARVRFDNGERRLVTFDQLTPRAKATNFLIGHLRGLAYEIQSRIDELEGAK